MNEPIPFYNLAGFYPHVYMILSGSKCSLNLLSTRKPNYMYLHSVLVLNHPNVKQCVNISLPKTHLKTLFNIVEEQLKKLLNFDVSAV